MSKLVHHDSPLCLKSELDVFLVPGTQTSIDRGQWQDYYPIASLDGNGPVEFVVPGTPDEYVDLAHTRLYLRVKVTKPDGTVPGDGENIPGPVNCFLSSLFSQLDVFLNDKQVTPASNTYPYRTYLENLLSYGKDAKNSFLTSELYYRDTPGKLDAAQNENTGLRKRANLLKNSGYSLELIGPLHADIFSQDRLLLNNVNIKVRLIRSKPEFCLITEDEEFKIEIEKAILKVRRVKVAPSVILGHAAALRKGTAKYPIKRVEVKVCAISAGSLGEPKDNLFQGMIPNRVIIGFIDHDSFNGTYKKNPFNFKHNHLSNLEVSVDGEVLPQKALETKFTQPGEFLEAYYTLFTAAGKVCRNEGLDISREDYSQGFTLIAFNLTADHNDEGCYFNPVKRGNFRLTFKLSEPLQQTVYLLVYAEFDNILEIDEARNVTYDYS